MEVEASPAVVENSDNRRSSCSTHAEALDTPGLTEWHLQFAIPQLRSFSQHVKNAVDTGIITGRARREIIQVLRTYMTAHTLYPTSEQYKTVCKKLITKFPRLKDTEGTHYVSTTYLITLCYMLLYTINVGFLEVRIKNCFQEL